LAVETQEKKSSKILSGAPGGKKSLAGRKGVLKGTGKNKKKMGAKFEFCGGCREIGLVRRVPLAI